MNLRNGVAALLREPLVHFMLAGAVVFALMAGRAPDVGERRIVVNETVVSRLADRWTENFRSPPSQQELDGLISEYVRDQVYYREALRLGLDKDDEVVMRRMRNKMLALATSDVEAATPSDSELQKLIDKDPARYAPEVTYSFDQLYLGADAPAARHAAGAALKALQAGQKADRFAQPAPIPGNYSQSAASDVAAVFGGGFADALRGLPIGQWRGPVASGIGLHLVRVTARSAPTPPNLDKVRQQVTNDWHNAARIKAEDEAYRKVLANYDVVIEQPK